MELVKNTAQLALGAKTKLCVRWQKLNLLSWLSKIPAEVEKTSYKLKKTTYQSKCVTVKPVSRDKKGKHLAPMKRGMESVFKVCNKGDSPARLITSAQNAFFTMIIFWCTYGKCSWLVGCHKTRSQASFLAECLATFKPSTSAKPAAPAAAKPARTAPATELAWKTNFLQPV